MTLLSTPSIESTPGVHMPYSPIAREFTQVAGTTLSFLGSGMLVTGEGLGVKWEIPRDLTGAPREAGSTEAARGSSPAQDERDLRLRLLARKYGRSSFTREDEARLEILNERLRRVMVRVSEEDVAALESSAQQLQDSRAFRKQIEEKYGL